MPKKTDGSTYPFPKDDLTFEMDLARIEAYAEALPTDENRHWYCNEVNGAAHFHRGMAMLELRPRPNALDELPGGQYADLFQRFLDVEQWSEV